MNQTVQFVDMAERRFVFFKCLNPKDTLNVNYPSLGSIKFFQNQVSLRIKVIFFLVSLNVFLVSKQLALLSSEITVFSDSPVKYTYFNLTPCNVICCFTVTDLCTSLTEYLDHQSHENQQRNGSSAIASRRCDILFVSIYNYPDILYNNILLFPEVMYLGTCKMLVLENSWQALSSGFGIPHLGA